MTAGVVRSAVPKMASTCWSGRAAVWHNKWRTCTLAAHAGNSGNHFASGSSMPSAPSRTSKATHAAVICLAREAA